MHKYNFELKIHRGAKTLPEGLEQIQQYMDTFDAAEGWLIIFDQRVTITWDEKIYMKKEVINGKTVTVVGA